MAEPEQLNYDIDELVRRAKAMIVPGARNILGITGAPGSGKSTLAADLVGRLGPDSARLVAMDGFHLADSLLAEFGRAERKGAPDTFDAAGYAVMLGRIRRGDPVVVPEFRRDIDEPLAAARYVPAEIPLVVTEGNYLLLEGEGEGEWRAARSAIDTVWHLELDGVERRRRLEARHIRFGKSPAAAREWTNGSDEANAVLIEAAARRADLIVHMPR
ncbi:nucleoside/nucleotide kinase family protein [Spelaeicoccus albus]|uniref:Pantothenate kinase n=1 Tax=Spelaeicoccus albus TaxID=1280376 RepID=A0A7Z0AAB4_9MICO|nr:nucleoside/nucleotide kinase family protein [Spelaeicoccus albus]NYI67319.1 pantothenate kinase [Spelaeicoccus albus]